MKGHAYAERNENEYNEKKKKTQTRLVKSVLTNLFNFHGFGPFPLATLSHFHKQWCSKL